jgi:hypothetical protein
MRFPLRLLFFITSFATFAVGYLSFNNPSLRASEVKVFNEWDDITHEINKVGENLKFWALTYHDHDLSEMNRAFEKFYFAFDNVIREKELPHVPDASVYDLQVS